MEPGDVVGYLPLVKTVAGRLASRLPRHVDIDDLVGAGVLGLLNAARQFDETKGVPFDRYAEIRVRGAILDELRNQDQTTRSARRASAEVSDVTRGLASALGRAPTAEEIAGGLGVSIEQYLEMVSRISPVVVLGFDDLGLAGEDERRDVMQYLRDPSAADPEAETSFREAAGILARAIEQLTARQRQVVTFYYYEGMSFKEIADLLSLTEGRISQLHTAAVAKLKTLLGTDPAPLRQM
ncbi:MAG: FliA/WhiG family RNA polymerase sigma factor [Deltaproteobacteria bacterium]|nr:FliA/WhiG family RNA polymerase sigma factor [Deltaproteobacteria bacterium]